MNIVLFGDSILGRLGKVYITQLEALIPGSVVHNCATGGFNSTDLARRAKHIAALKPDIALLSFGVNDVSPWKDIVALNDFVSNARVILEAFKGSRVILLKCPHVSLVDSQQTAIVNTRLDEYYNEISVRFGSECSTIDTNILFAGIDNFHEEDGLHFNEDAYEILVSELALRINS